jgi:hypothetical protein
MDWFVSILKMLEMCSWVEMTWKLGFWKKITLPDFSVTVVVGKIWLVDDTSSALPTFFFLSKNKG